ncbi:Sialic acid TRAP transporter permease protein SiaT [Moorella thermoacetica]|uniref:Sialic acid TRAP transporter permease protein SiaT n=1 Tax=Neomoorella thermoacetica TaxID=1525 RepID=A0AAC9MTT6_NEOTH|nr:TRAP transporter large permease [Moorella thermoacetica]AOQ22919.1 Sialic acid TRAP transporter permease protein SiaT [Moorella thermoacetica]TYL10552.1 Sialic acid TRAP transporter permease protein SiaT [Moorella thermoacetica]
MLIAIVFLVALVVGIPIAYVLGMAGFTHMMILNPSLLTALPQRLFVSANNYGLLAIPLFILAGELMEISGDVERLLAFARALVGQIKGGLAYVMVILGFLLGGPLGSANAEAALLGSTMFPQMKKDGYDEVFTACLIAAISVVGPLIPPGMLLVIYGVVSGVSISDLFMAGIMPGIYLTIALGLVVYFYGRKSNWPVTEWQGGSHVWYTFKRAFFSIAAPIAVLAAIASGICTPTEAAAVASVLTLLIGYFIYRKIKLSDLVPIFLRTGVMSGAVLMIGAMGGVFGWTLAMDQFPQKVAALVLSITRNPLFMLLLLNILILVVGMFMDAIPAVMILVPVLMPIIKQMGYDPVHFGMMMCFNLTVGLIHPPIGTVIYTTSAATGVSIDRLFIPIWTWVAVCVAVLLLIAYFPGSIMFLPKMLAR